ncbi:MAG: hypothetical protein CMJ08_02030 [Pelagibacterales bacterium]|nr:hypothetical protein [Pelagibacterales bacterium]|tara:strand:+ start:405 stop:1064 length:660 start_codon:yes stop_codon:yes gene_type:complete
MPSNVINSTNIENNILNIEFKNIRNNNALSLLMLDDLLTILSRKNLNKKYQVIVFKGYGNSPFSAGADLNDIKMLKKTNNIEIYHKKLNAVLNKLRKLNIITVSVINDFCIGAGFIFSMYTDISIVNDNCIFSIPASKLNIKLPKSQLDYIFNKFPKNKLLKEVILTGRKFTAYEALNFHLINIVYQNKNFKKKYLDFLSNFMKNDEKIRGYYFKKLYH